MPLTPRSARSQNARRRVEAPERYHLLDTPPESFFKGIVRTTANLLGASIALISLAGREGEWKRWVVGAEEEKFPSDASFCIETIASSGGMVVNDATQDERFADHPAVTEPIGARFYAGVPLRTPQGVPFGCLSVMDVQPQSLSDAQRKQLEALADVVVYELEHRSGTASELHDGRMNPHSSESTDPISLDELGPLLRTSAQQVLLLDSNTLTILDASPAASGRFESENDDLRRHTFTDVLRTSKEELERQLQPIREGTATQVLLKVTEDTENGPRPIHFLVLETPTDSSSVLVAFVLMFSERLRLEARLRQRENIETVRTLVGGVAHNFNNILHSAIVYLQMAIEDLKEGGSPIAFLERTEEDLHEVASLVSKLQTFSRAEGKAITIPIDVSEIVEKAIPLVESILPPDAHLHSRLEADCTIMGDPAQIQEMVVNLLTNAIEAIEDDGEIQLVVEKVEVDPESARRFLHLTPGPHVRVSVQDTGTGMDPEMQVHIFEPFYTTKEGPRVAGLGLSVVDGIVRAHEGQIDLQTEEGEGTTVYVYLPYADASPPSAQ